MKGGRIARKIKAFKARNSSPNFYYIYLTKKILVVLKFGIFLFHKITFNNYFIDLIQLVF